MHLRVKASVGPLCMTNVISLWPKKKLGTMMPCMTHVISFFNGKAYINGPKKIGTVML